MATTSVGARPRSVRASTSSVGDAEAGRGRGQGQALDACSSPTRRPVKEPGPAGDRVARRRRRGFEPELGAAGSRPRAGAAASGPCRSAQRAPRPGSRSRPDHGHARRAARRVDGEDAHGPQLSATRLHGFPPCRRPTLASDPRHAAVPPDEGGAPGRAAVLPHGRLLRAVLRGRGGGGAALEIALTSRSKDKDGDAHPHVRRAPPRGHRPTSRRLVKQGFRVALCEQMEDPRTAKGVVQARGRAGGHARHAARGRRARGRRDRPSCWRWRPAPTAPRRGLARRHHRRVLGRGVGRARRAGSGCATSSAATRPREILVPRGARAARLAARSRAAGGARSRARELDDGALRPAQRRGASCSRHFGVADASRPSAARRCPLATAAGGRRAALRARDAEARPRPRHRPAHARRGGRPGHRRAHAPQPRAGREPGRRRRGAARCSTSST